MKNPEHLRPDSPDQPVILVVDDDVLVENIVRITLERNGYFVLTAQNGEEALTLSRSYPGEIHMILSDIEMPGMNGIDLSKHLSKERPSTCIVLMSGSFKGGPMEGVHFIRKPFRVDELSRKVKELLVVCPQR
jgi:two-component system cell cycle sensor histidine kinase/response regulator CckA